MDDATTPPGGDLRPPTDRAAEPPPSPGAQPGLETTSDPIEVRDALESSSGVAPSRRERGDGQPQPPAIIVDSAEGVTTYAGFNGDPRSKRARSWAAKELRAKLTGFARAPDNPDEQR